MTYRINSIAVTAKFDGVAGWQSSTAGHVTRRLLNGELCDGNSAGMHVKNDDRWDACHLGACACRESVTADFSYRLVSVHIS
jgi:hypothetical protein